MGILGFQVSQKRYSFQIVIHLPPSISLLRPACAFAILTVGIGLLDAQDPPKPEAPVKMGTLPERFFQIQDDAGFLWQALDNGALISGDTQYLQSGLNLIVDGEPFAPTAGGSREPGSGEGPAEVRLEERRASGPVIGRSLWFDTKRSGVRALDSFSNTGTAERRFEVVVRTTYPFAWQSLHGAAGRVLGTEPAIALTPDDIALGVHFSPSEGRHDTFFLFGSEKGGQRPDVKSSANLRELTLTYSVSVPPGETRYLVHWILQRNLSEVGQSASVLLPFARRGQWIEPGIPEAETSKVANLPAAAFVAEAPATNLRMLVPLNELTDRLGAYRRAEDLLWVGPSSQLPGQLVKEGRIKLAAETLGETEIPIALLAGVKGGGGEGATPKWYLRDGRVLVGDLVSGSLLWGGSASDAKALDPDEFHLLLTGTTPADGSPENGTTHFLQLADGTVLALAMGKDSAIDWATPWGRRSIAWADTVEWTRLAASPPQWRVSTRDGSWQGGLPIPRQIGVKTHAGKEIEVSASEIQRVWSAGAPPQLATAPSAEWVDFSEIPAGFGPKTGVLLAGNHLVAGELAASTLLVRDGASRFPVDTARIVRFSRSDEPDAAGRFTLLLDGGESVEGSLVDAYLSLAVPGATLEVPMEFVLAYQKSPSSE